MTPLERHLWRDWVERGERACGWIIFLGALGVIAWDIVAWYAR